jgi:hypothetical protein
MLRLPGCADRQRRYLISLHIQIATDTFNPLSTDKPADLKEGCLSGYA